MQSFKSCVALLLLTSFSILSCEEAVTTTTLNPPLGKCLPVGNGEPSYTPLNEYLANTQRFRVEVNEQLMNNNKALAATGNQPSQHLTFSFEVLKKFMYDVEQQYKDTGGAVPEDLALTWSFAMYGTEDNFPDNKENYRGLHTLYGIPSIITADGSARPMLLSQDIGNNQPVRLEGVDLNNAWINYVNGVGEINGLALMLSSETPELDVSGNPFNRGALCPPTCNDDMISLDKLPLEGEETTR